MKRNGFSVFGVVTICLLLVVLFVIMAVANDYEGAAKIEECFNASGRACKDVLLPNGTTLQDYYDRTGRIPTVLH